MSPLTVLLPLLLASLGRAEDCALPHPHINITIFKHIDSSSENLTVADSVHHPHDAFHLLLDNQTLPCLPPLFFHIQNELSVLQVINSGVRDIRPGAFNITPTLALLRIVGNPIATLHERVFSGLKVKEIDLSQNAIGTVAPQAFDDNPHLQVLTLNHNQLKEINPNWFLNSPNVYKLSAAFNDIQDIPPEAFKNMDASRPIKVWLSSNRISKIAEDAFHNHHTIQLLRINGNKVASLPENLFVNRTIRNLLVNMNQLQCFPEEMFQSAIDTLAFIDNTRFECECLKRVRKFANDYNVTVWYPSVICEDRTKEISVVFNYNKTYEIPLLTPTDVDGYAQPAV